MRGRIVFLLVGWLCYASVGYAQEDETQTVKEMSFEQVDSLGVASPDSTVLSVVATADSLGVPEVKVKEAFKPDPKKAVLYALIPGLGQIYNRKYWKLPILYGGLMGCIYAITWNNKNYQDYSEAYSDVIYDATVNPDDPDLWHTSWQELTSQDPSDVVSDDNFQDALKDRKDYFRRYRDLSIIIMVGVYAIGIIDAYVDAQLFDFDISPDLTMHVEPVVTPKTNVTPRTYGLNCSFNF